MADTYYINFTDSSTGAIEVDAGSVNGPDQPQRDTDLSLIGQTKIEYGTLVNENFLRLLENFAHEEDVAGQPDPEILATPIDGQLWFNKTDKFMYVYDGADWFNLTPDVTDLITEADADLRFVNIDGDSMTGALTVPELISENNVVVESHVVIASETESNAVGLTGKGVKFISDNEDHSYGIRSFNTVSGPVTSNYVEVFHDIHDSDTTYTDTNSIFRIRSSNDDNAGHNNTTILQSTYNPTNVTVTKIETFIPLKVSSSLDVVGTSQFNNNRIQMVGTPTATSDAATKGYVDTAIADIVAGTSGSLDVPTADSRYVNVTGDTMGGQLSMGGFKITNLATPTNNTDAAIKSYVDALFAQALASAIPTGTILPYGGSVAPAGYLMCQAGTASRTTDAALFAIIGTTYGVGDGSSTFGLPDGRGRVPVGAGQGPGLTNRVRGTHFGEENHLQLISEMPAHGHRMRSSNYNISIHDIPGRVLRSNFGVDATANLMETTGGGLPFNVMQPSFVTNYIIKR